MKKNIVHVLAITLTASVFADYVENLGQAASNVAASAVDIAAATVGETVPARTKDSNYGHHSRWSRHNDYGHDGLRARIDKHRYATHKQKLAADEEKLAQYRSL